MKSIYPLLFFLVCSVLSFAQFDKNKEILFEDLEVASKENPLRVYHLDLSNQGLKEFPEKILEFENLIYLNLGYNEISNLNDLDFYSLKKLEHLDLYGNKIKVFPYETLDKAKNLLTINLAENEISEIDNQLNRLRFLEELDLSGNRILKTAEDIKLPFLTTLKLDQNYLTETPSFIFQSLKLEHLNLYGNSIKIISKEFRVFPKLKYLNIGDNPLEYISDAFAYRKLNTLILDWIDFSNNNLKLDFIQKSSRLEILSMEHCNLTEIPESVFTLRRLKEFSVLNNELLHVNKKITGNKNLVKLWLGGNNIKDSELAFLKQNMKATEIIIR